MPEWVVGEIGEMVGLPKTWVKLEDGLWYNIPQFARVPNLVIWVILADDDVMPLVASSAGLPGFLGGGDPILPISEGPWVPIRQAMFQSNRWG